MGSVTATQCTMMSFFIIFPMAVLNLFCKSWMRTADEIIFSNVYRKQGEIPQGKTPSCLLQCAGFMGLFKWLKVCWARQRNKRKWAIKKIHKVSQVIAWQVIKWDLKNYFTIFSVFLPVDTAIEHHLLARYTLG